MARSHTDPTTAIPEADLLEQRTPTTPEPLSLDVRPATADPFTADEADLLDQLAALPVDEEAYPNAHTSGGDDA